jgi:imidazolonepropionase
MRILIKNIKQLVQVEEGEPVFWKRGKEAMQSLPFIEDAFLLIENGLIADFGTMKTFIIRKESSQNFDKEMDATGCFVLPCWCDSHTHLVFANSREDEFVDRIRGLSYEEIARRGGGILNSARKVNEASENELYDLALQRIEEAKNSGTGAMEMKSGYGLTPEGELKMLRVIKKLKENSELTIKATFLGAHTYPLEYRNNHAAYIRLIKEEMLPQIAKEGLADYVDIFCEKGFFSVAESEKILEAALHYKMRIKLHTNQLHRIGGIQMGVKWGAVSVDHLENIATEDIYCLASGHTIATLLPSAAFFIGTGYPPARGLIDAGVPVALATDYNPGSSPGCNMQFVISLACIKMKMLPEEALNATTINGAAAMEVQHQVGSIARGKIANVIITKPVSSLAFLPYSFSTNLISRVILNGKC